MALKTKTYHLATKYYQGEVEDQKVCKTKEEAENFISLENSYSNIKQEGKWEYDGEVGKGYLVALYVGSELAKEYLFDTKEEALYFVEQANEKYEPNFSRKWEYVGSISDSKTINNKGD